MPINKLVGTCFFITVCFFLYNPSISMGQAIRAVNILSIDDVAGTSRSVPIPIDSTISSLTIDADYSLPGSYVVTLRRPDASVVQVTDPNVIIELSPKKTSISVSNPVQGSWTVDLSGGGPINLFVGGLSSLDLNSCEFVRPEGRPGHGGFISPPGEPVVGRVNYVQAVMTQETSSANFDFRNAMAQVLQAPTLTKLSREGRHYYFGRAIPPSSEVRCYVTGLSLSGEAYQRMTPRLFSAQPFVVEPPPPQDLVPGLQTTYRFAVTNLGPPDVFTMTGSDKKNFLLSVTPSVATLALNESMMVDVVLQTPAAALRGTSDVIRLDVLGARGSKNYAAVKSAVFMRSTVSIPSVQGLLDSAALTTLTNAGLVIGRKTEQSSSSPTGTVLSQNPVAGTVVPINTPVDLTVAKRLAVLGDLDGDDDVDKNDINIVLAAKGTAATGPNDPRDIDKDGQITLLDARKLATMCTRPNCATQ